VCTFHSFCYRVLAEQGKKENAALPVIIDDDDKKRLISDVISHLNEKEKTVDTKSQKLLDHIVKAKQQLVQPADTTSDITGDKENSVFHDAYETYERFLSTQGLLDYEDLIFHVVRLFESNTEALKAYQDSFEHIFVDEYQDLNLGQYSLIRALAPQESNLCVIGDPDQSMDYPDSEVINLQQNYRSTETILQSSHQIIKSNHTSLTGARIHSNIDGIQTISILELATEKAEAETVVKTVQQMVGGTVQQMVGGTGFHDIDLKRVKDANSTEERVYSDVAVLYRTNDQGRFIGGIFDAMGIPYQIARKESFLKSKSLSALISLMQVIHGSGSYIDFERASGLLNKSLGKNLVSKFKAWGYEKGFSLESAILNAKRFPIKEMDRTHQNKLNDAICEVSGLKKRIIGLSVKETLEFLVENTNLTGMIKSDEKERDAIHTALDFSMKFENNFDDFKSAAALQTDSDSYTHRVEKVSLMTMHASKGLEFNVVFIVGCEDGYIPFVKNERKPTDINEERRLFYVAMTRAREQLFLTYSKKRKIYGKSATRQPSPFLSDTVVFNIFKKEKNIWKKRNETALTVFK
ncbi:MAG: ATP-dependent helicase, partial [Deltaproteobacteria bacterium]|nr:ATP-dependent helicase [Deltaproteobacteria bacterium]